MYMRAIKLSKLKKSRRAVNALNWVVRTSGVIKVVRNDGSVVAYINGVKEQ